MRLSPTWLAAIALSGTLVLAGCTDLGEPVRTTGPDPTPVCDSVLVTAGRDATLYEDSAGGLANGAGEFLFAGKTSSLAGELIRRSLLWFDVRSAVPAGAQVVSVTLTMEVSRSSDPTARTMSLHRVHAAWSEGTADPPAEEGPGDLAGLGDVTWLHRDYDSVLWGTAGGDFGPAPIASAGVGGAGEVRWTGPELVQEVVRVLDPAQADHGWLLRGEEAISQTARRFHSRESTSGAKPVLTVRYCFPVP